jgi:hypothetical protein
MDKKKSKLVVELGCGFGLQLCFLALLKPKLTFIGFDCSEKAIQSAQALAQSLQLKNIRFERQSIETISTDQSKLKQACGLVFSSLLQQEIKSCIGNEWLPDDEFEAQALQCDEIQYEALMQYALNACVQNQQQGTFPVIEAAQFLIHPLTGTYISYERLANGLDYCTWVGMLIQKGLQVHFKESQIIQSYHVLHQCYEKIPLFVAHPTFGSVMRLLDARQG